jgi:hypothetical protein
MGNDLRVENEIGKIMNIIVFKINASRDIGGVVGGKYGISGSKIFGFNQNKLVYKVETTNMCLVPSGHKSDVCTPTFPRFAFNTQLMCYQYTYIKLSFIHN